MKPPIPFGGRAMATLAADWMGQAGKRQAEEMLMLESCVYRYREVYDALSAGLEISGLTAFDTCDRVGRRAVV